MAKEDYKGIWVFAEQENGVLSETTFELLAKSADLKAKLGGTDEISAVVLGDDVAGLADKLFAYGAEAVIVAENDNLKNYSARPYAKVLTELSEKYKPSIFLFPASPLGRDLAPRVMCDLRTGLTADAIDLDIDEDGVFVQTTPNFGGNILSHICIMEKRPQMVTVHPKVFSPITPVEGAKGKLIVEKVDVEADDCYTVIATEKRVFEGKPIADCSTLVAGGRGVKSEEDLAMLRELADGGSAVFFSSHVLEVVEKLCNKVAIIRGGELLAAGPTERVRGDESLEAVFLDLVEDPEHPSNTGQAAQPTTGNARPNGRSHLKGMK